LSVLSIDRTALQEGAQYNRQLGQVVQEVVVLLPLLVVVQVQLLVRPLVEQQLVVARVAVVLAAVALVVSELVALFVAYQLVDPLQVAHSRVLD